MTLLLLILVTYIALSYLFMSLSLLAMTCLLLCLDSVDLYIQIPRLGTKWNHPPRTKSIWASRRSSSNSLVLYFSFWLTGSLSLTWASCIDFCVYPFGLGYGNKTLVKCNSSHNLYNLYMYFYVGIYGYTTLCVILWSCIVLLCLAYIRGGFFWPTYIRRSDVPVFVESGRYKDFEFWVWYIHIYVFAYIKFNIV